MAKREEGPVWTENWNFFDRKRFNAHWMKELRIGSRLKFVLACIKDTNSTLLLLDVNDENFKVAVDCPAEGFRIAAALLEKEKLCETVK